MGYSVMQGIMVFEGKEGCLLNVKSLDIIAGWGKGKL